MSPVERPVALVTGAARRVGRALALELAGAGFDIVMHFNRSGDEAAATAAAVRDVGGRAHLVQADLAEHPAAAKVVERSLQAAGRLDALVNNASIFEPMTLEGFDIEAWHDTLQINLAAPIQLIRHAAAELRQRRGCVVNLCDIHADRPLQRYLAYGPSKAGLDHVTRALALALAPEVRVNGVAPGIAVFPEAYSDELRQRLIERVPLGRPGTPEDIARAVRFLIESPYITGQIINVDGGRSVG